MSVMSHDALLREMWSLYHKVIQSTASGHGNYPGELQRYSAQNLLAFIAYKNSISVELIRALRMRGLELSSIQHVAHSLHVLCVQLGMTSLQNAAYIEDPEWITKGRRREVLGPKADPQTPHLMLTLDAKMISSSVIEDYLRCGMTIARINCAYADQSAWLRLIETIRGAEHRLREKGQYGNQTCQIFMDLAGPKIRIRHLTKSLKPLKLEVKEDSSGKPLFKTGIISWSGIKTRLLHSSDFDFQISIPYHDDLHKLQQGDVLTFLDIRKKRRRFVITKLTPAGFVVTLQRTAIIDEQTVLHNAEHEISLAVTELEQSYVKVQVGKSDRLRIWLTDHWTEQTAGSSDIPSVMVSLPEAFENIRSGQAVYIDDGKIHGIVSERASDYIDLEIRSPETPVTIQESKGINLPDTFVGGSVPVLTSKDEEDLAFVCRYADLAGFSFVKHPADLHRLKKVLAQHGRADMPVILKIETKQAIENFSKILLEGLSVFSKFGVMVARGDLAIEIGFKELLVVQEEILSMCRAAHTPVILATQVLNSLAKKGIPSRSELADVSFGREFDCVMLNKGPFMKETVEFIREALFLITEYKEHKHTITRP